MTDRRVAALVFVVVLGATQAAVGMRASRTASVTGDEPFYLLTAQSLVSDGDLDLRDEYANRDQEMTFWDGTVPLWKQMQPAPDGRLLAPHDPGLPVLVAPAYALGGLRGVQRFLALLWSAAMAVAALLALRALRAIPTTRLSATKWGPTPLRGQKQRAVGMAGVAVAAVAVGAGAPGIVYASQVYPEGPAALCVALGFLVATGKRPRPVALAAATIALAWLGVKYVPLGLLVTGAWAWRFRADRLALAVAGGLGAVAAAVYAWWHVANFGALTPYSTNVVWAGEGTSSILRDHVDVGDRLYRLFGLFVDARFGLLRWSPVAILAAVGIAKATARYAAALAICVLMGTFASITIMGWWFPGRMLIAALPAVVVLVAAGAAQVPRVVAGALAAWSVAIGAVVAWGAHHRWIRLAVDPFDLGPPLAPRWLFPDFRELAAPEVLATAGWVALVVGLVSVTRWRRSCLSTGTPSRTGRSSRSRPIWRLLPGR
ncbi:MAG TPA: hypothetical protein VF230_03130 [Acidimicrobiales bacterium]